MGSYTVSTLAMIVFFICVALAHFVTANALVGLVEGVSAIVAAVALLAHK